MENGKFFDHRLLRNRSRNKKLRLFFFSSLWNYNQNKKLESQSEIFFVVLKQQY